MRLFHRPGPRLSVSCLATWPSPPQALLLAHHPFLSGWRIPVVVSRLLLGSHGIAPLFLPTIPFGIVVCTFSVDNLSRLAVYGYIFYALSRMLMNLLITRSELSGYEAGAV